MENLAVGDLVGSSLFNLLILALLDLTHRSHGQMLSRTASAHALSGITGIALATTAAIFMLISHRWPKLALGGMSLGSFAILITYALSVRLVFYDQRLSAQQAELQAIVVPPEEASGKRLTLSTAVIGFIISAIAILLTGPFMAEAAGKLAELTKLGNTFMGSTLVAFCTSLPELAATLTAVRIGALDLAIGNIYGSNAFNMVLLVPLDLFSAGPLLANVSQTHAVTCLCTVLITALAIMGQLYQMERRIHFLEPDALVIITLVFASLGLIYVLR
jgi:cation:H+ antiporter